MFVCALAVGIHRFWNRCPLPENRGGPDGYRRWLLRGLVFPTLAWQLWDLFALWGPAAGLRPLTPFSNASPLEAYAGGLAVLLCIAGISWTLCSLSWLLPDTIRAIRKRDELHGWMLVTGVPSGLLGMGCLWFHSWMTLALTWSIGLWILLEASLSLVHVPRVSYSRAVARMKSGRYSQAEQEILAQLEEKSDDFEGWMMLATLYAEQFGELRDARATIFELCEQPDLTPFHIAQAFNRLADWELNRAQDPVGARTALLEITTRCAGTPFATVAEHRLRQLPTDDVELRESRRPRVLRLPALSEAQASTQDPAPSELDRMDFREEATRLTSRLERDPNHIPTRLRLARNLAEKQHRVDEAIRHLHHLRNHADARPTEQAEWLALEAAWELRIRRRELRARELLVQLTREHPQTGQSIAAARQLELLDRAAEASASVASVPKPPPTLRIPPAESDDPGRSPNVSAAD
ncbi:MAG: hypothetical protein U1G08_17135 [Verrucomicrobiota bacterium]